MAPRGGTKKLVQRVVIGGVGVLAIISGGAGLAGQARADNPDCVADVTNACPQQAQQANAPRPDPPPRSHIRVYCQPGGSKWGAFCFQRWVP
jgi:hypothetical protein